ncbi:competence protein CoiA family protein [Kribbella sp. NPDC059898]|uniref:competence protein CoiA family protein n=1 Tax=Kribbella sp. NPDC059898 TaxID=3346995 RepID=UPI0036573CFE
MSKQLAVPGLDPRTGKEVRVDDESIEYWQELRSTGRIEVVCLLCYHGWDLAEPAEVPVIFRGKIGGLVRPHFAHKRGHGPSGGHGPETMWHYNTKLLIAAWATARPEVQDVAVERWTPQRRRRSDVQVRLATGETVAIEVQQQRLTDEAWRRRHQDYAAAGIVDVWLWHPTTDVPGVVLAEGLRGWTIDLPTEHVSLVQDPLYTSQDGSGSLEPRGRSRVTAPLTDITLSPTGLEFPPHLLPAEEPVPEAPDAPVAPPGEDLPGTSEQPALFDPENRPRRPLVMLFPGGRRPPRFVYHLLSPPDQEHRIYRPDALPPYANAPGSPRYVCWTCGLIVTAPDNHP